MERITSELSVVIRGSLLGTVTDICHRRTHAVMAQYTPLREGPSFSSSRYTCPRSRTRHCEEWFDPVEAPLRPRPSGRAAIHPRFQAKFNYEFLAGRPASANSEAKVETNAHYRAIEDQSARITLPADRMFV